MAMTSPMKSEINSIADGGDEGYGYVEMSSASYGSVDPLLPFEIEKIRHLLHKNSKRAVDGGGDGDYGHVETSSSAPCRSVVDQLTPLEIERIRHLLHNGGRSRRVLFQEQQQQQRQQQQWQQGILEAKPSIDSDQTEFKQSTHAWWVSSKEVDSSGSEALMDRIIGAIIIGFQLLTYYLFAAEAIEDYQKGAVEVTTTHDYCAASDFAPQENFMCEVDNISLGDAFVSFFMLAIFLASDVQQALRSIRKARSTSLLAQALAGVIALEVFCAFAAASISISQKLYIGEVTDAIEAGVGLLFVRELSTRAYRGMRRKEKKVYVSFFCVLLLMIGVGMLVHPVCEVLIAP